MSQFPQRRSGDGDHNRSAKSGHTVWIVLGIVVGVILLSIVICGGLAALILPAVQQARTAARNAQFQNNLKQVGLGAHGFHETYNQFPPMPADGSVVPDVTSPVSFNTALLPYMGQGVLYGRIDTTIPWDAPANRTAYQAELPVYLSPVFENWKTAAGYGATYIVPNSRMIQNGSGLAMSDVKDGLGNTILAGGIDDTAVPAWGDPENDRDPANGFAGGANEFGGTFNQGAQILFCDGSVRIMSAKTAPEIAKALATPDGAEEMGDE